jgi:hypothetical protein
MAGKEASDPEAMNVFRHKLLARRVAIWLYVCKGFKAVKIFAALTGTLDVENLYQRRVEELIGKSKGEVDFEALQGQGWKKLANSAKQLINTHLALSLSEFPVGLLVEEKAWLKSEMGVDIYDIEDLLVQVGYHIKVALEEWGTANPDRLNEISAKTDLLPPGGRPLVTTFADAKRLLKVIYESLRMNSSPEEKRQYNLLVGSVQAKLRADRYCSRYLDEFSKHVGKFIS